MINSSFYRELEKSITDLLKSLEDVLSMTEMEEAITFIKHGEYGLALETLCSIIKEEDKKINGCQLDKIREIQKLMEIANLPIDDET